MNREKTIRASVLVVWFGLLISSAYGETYYVNVSCGNDGWSGSDPCCVGSNGPKKTIQAGIDAAVNGDTVIVAPGTYKENILIYFYGENITITSIDPDDPAIVGETIIDGGQSGATVELVSGDSSCYFQGFTITGGKTVRNGGES